MTEKKLFRIILICILISNGCSKFRVINTEPKNECIVESNCGSISNNLIMRDTFSYNSSFLKIEPIKIINNYFVNEWSLSFLNKKNGFLTATDKVKTVILTVNFISVDSIEIKNPLLMNHQYSAGFITGSLNSLICASDYDSISAGDLNLTQLSIDSSGNSTNYLLHDSLRNYWDSHPSISSNGELLFFASNRDGKENGLDLFVMLKSKLWTKPFNCGNIINSACNELSPFSIPNKNILLFSSSRNNGAGGYDIYTAEYNPELLVKGVETNNSDLIRNSFTKPKNIGKPINTQYDELFPSTPDEDWQNIIYYSSNQQAIKTQSFDLFVARKINRENNEPISEDIESSSNLSQKSLIKNSISDNIMVEISPDKVDQVDNKLVSASASDEKVYVDSIFIVKGLLIEESSNKPITNADITSYLYPENILIDKSITDSLGFYAINVYINHPVQIKTESDKYFSTIRIDTFTLRDTIKLINEPIVLPKILSLRVNFPTKEFTNPYKYLYDSLGFETNKTLNDELKEVSDNIKKYDDKIKYVLIIGHTDDIGTNKSNLILGEKRAENLKRRLISMGVNPAILRVESMGESDLPIKRIDEDIDQFRLRSRRVEFLKVLQ
ncbi:MAG: OmpA family protein [Ignavibacteria bacterium]